MNIQYIKLRLLGQPFRCGGGGGGGGGGGSVGDASDPDGSVGGGGTGVGDASDPSGSVGGGGGDYSGDASFEADWGAVTSGGLTASEQAAADAAAANAAAAAAAAQAQADAQAAAAAAAAQVQADAAAEAAAFAAAQAAAQVQADADAEAAAAQAQAYADAVAAEFAASPIGQAQSAIFSGSLTQDQATQAANLHSTITGMSPMDSLMVVESGFGTSPGLNAFSPSHSPGITYADIAVAHTLGFGNQDVTSGQTVNQAIAAAAVHSGLNNNIGQVMGAIGGPVVGMIATAANAVAQGHSFASVAGEIAASIVGTAVSNMTGLPINASTINAIANGQLGQAAMGLAIGQISESTGLSINVVTAALNGNLGAAVANTMMEQVIGSAAQSLSAGPLGGLTISAMMSKSGAPAAIANSINQSAIGQAVNSATSAIFQSVASSGIGVSGGLSGLSSAVASVEAGGSAVTQGELLSNAVDSGALEKTATVTPVAPGASAAQAAPSAPKKPNKYWLNLNADLNRAFSRPPAERATNTANEMYANQAKAQALITAERDYTDIFGSLTPDVAEAITSAKDPVKYVDSLYTTDEEAREFWRSTVGTEPTEFDLLEIIGLDEGQAVRIAEDRATTSMDEAELFFRDLYGSNYQPTTDQLMEVLGRPEGIVKNEIQDTFIQAKEPNFNVDEYRKINGLSADDDPYRHWITEGRFNNVKTNDKDVAVQEAVEKYEAATNEPIPLRIREALTRPENQDRDKAIQQYVDTTLKDREVNQAFRNSVAKSVIDAYDEEGLSPEQVRAKIDSGEAKNYIDGAIQRKQESIAQMQEYTKATAEKYGVNSTEYKEAYRDTLDAMAEVGGYGVVKDGDSFVLPEAGKLNPGTLRPSANDGGGYGYVDPVTGIYTVEMWMRNRENRDISSLWTLGQSAKPPTQGGDTVFGDGSGVSAGLFVGLLPIAIDNGRGDAGAAMYGGGNGFALITYSDGHGAAIDTKTQEVIWMYPEDVQKLLRNLPEPKEPLPVTPNPDALTPVKPPETNPVQDVTSEIKGKIQSPKEVLDALMAMGYTPTEEEVKSLAGEKTLEQLQDELTTYVDPRLVTEQEVKDAYAELGLTEPTQADIDKLVGQYEQELLAERTQENLSTAQFNKTAAQQEATQQAVADLEAQSAEQYGTLSEAQKATADALVAQGATLSEAIESAKTETAGQIADVETRLTDAIAAAEAMGLSRDQAITAAVESVAADIGITKADLLTQMGTTEKTLRSEFATGLAGVSAEVQSAYDSLSADQQALADQLAQQGVDLTTAIQTAQEQTAGAIETISADVQAKYDALTTEQKALADAMAQQGLDLTAAIDLAAQQTQEQITGLGESVDVRINELMQQGQTYQQATQQAIGELTQQNQQLQDLVGTQGRTPTQGDIDALAKMVSGQSPVDPTYDVTGDGQVTQADLDYLSGVVAGGGEGFIPSAGSFLGPTGLYGELAGNEARRQSDNQALARANAQRQRQTTIRTTLDRGQQQLRQMVGQVPQAFQQAQTTTTPIYGEMGPYLDLGSPLDFDFFKPSPEKQAATKQQQPTKIATGGYIDDLLVGDMSVDDLLNLLR